MAADDLIARIGGGICDAATALLDEIVAADATLRNENFKFISESILVTSRIATPAARALNARLGEVLLSDQLRLILLRNPRSVVMYAMPVTFLTAPPPRAAAVLDLFGRLHAACGTKALHHPEYRNLEQDFLAARAAGDGFFHDPFAGAGASLPWADRDLVYGITHVHFYNSDFGARSVRYPGEALALLELLIAQAAQGGDVDVLLELLICYASTAGAEAARLAFHDRLCAEAIEGLCGAGLTVPHGDAFREIYHPLYVAAIYLAVRGRAFAPGEAPAIARRHAALGELLATLARCELIEFLAGYADHAADHGPEPGIEPALALHGALLSAAVHDRAANSPAAAAA